MNNIHVIIYKKAMYDIFFRNIGKYIYSTDNRIFNLYNHVFRIIKNLRIFYCIEYTNI